MNNIEILEDFIDKQKSNKGTFVATDFEITALEKLIQENKELKEHLQKYYNGELFTAKQLKNIEENQRKYFIHKSKVKEKIEYYEEMKKTVPKEDTLFKAHIQSKIEALEELLEEGE